MPPHAERSKAATEGLSSRAEDTGRPPPKETVGSGTDSEGGGSADRCQRSHPPGLGKNQTSPQTDLIPRVICFLGYLPYVPPRSFSERLRTCRRALGLSRRKLAEKLDMAQITYVEDLVSLAGETIVVKRNLGNGWQEVKGQLPVLLTVLDTANEPRVPRARRLMNCMIT